MLRLVYCGFVARKEYWPACALLVVAPGMITDLGFEHYEKAAFPLLIAAFCMALAPVAARGAGPADGAPMATP